MMGVVSYTSPIPAARRLAQEDHCKFKGSLDLSQKPTPLPPEREGEREKETQR